MYISINKKVIWVEGSEQEERELKSRSRRAMFRQEKLLREQEADRRRRGYCPDCHVLLSLSHTCSRCGTTWNFYRTQHT